MEAHPKMELHPVRDYFFFFKGSIAPSFLVRRGRHLRSRADGGRLHFRADGGRLHFRADFDQSPPLTRASGTEGMAESTKE